MTFAVLRSASLTLPQLGRSVWVIAPDGAAIDEIYGVLDTLLERQPGYMLSGFAGEVQILSPILAAALAQRDGTANQYASS